MAAARARHTASASSIPSMPRPSATGCASICGDEGEILRCPWHGWSSTCGSGAALLDSKLQVRIYAVEVRDGSLPRELALCGHETHDRRSDGGKWGNPGLTPSSATPCNVARNAALWQLGERREHLLRVRWMGRLHRIRRTVRALQRHPRASRGSIVAFQDACLRDIARHAYDNVP